MDNDPNKEVKHWGCYGIEGTGNTHVMSLTDCRQSSGQVFIDAGPIDGNVDDIACLHVEIGTHPENGLDQVPCVHLSFDRDNLAFSAFKVGDGFLIRLETDVVVEAVEGGLFRIISTLPKTA